MDKKIQDLINYYGTRKKLAERLEITTRQLYNLQHGIHSGKHLVKTAVRLHEKIKSL